MRSLVIGGTLFIGRALVRRLLARGDNVTILHRGKHNPFGEAVHELCADRNDIAQVRALLSNGRYQLVFDNVYDWARGTTAEQVRAAAEACGSSLERYVFTSSVAAYGSGLGRQESDPLAPSDDPDLYCRNKAETERVLLRMHDEQGLPAVTLRPPFLYGPENPFYREQFFWDRLLADRPIILPGDGSRLMQFVYVHDYVNACLAVTEQDAAIGRAYNVANPHPITQRELVLSLAAAAGRPEPELVQIDRGTLISLGGNVFEPPYYFGQYYDMPPITMETARAQEDLDFQATSFAEGLEETFRWYRDSRSRTPDFSFDDRALAAA